MPGFFVLIWSTGFVVARLGMPYAPPFHFLCVRYALSLFALGLWMRLAGVAFPKTRQDWQHLALSGVLMHAGYLGGVWFAVHHGLAAGAVALVVALQPLLTALWLGGRRHESVARVQWVGLLLGLAGVALVVWPKVGLTSAVVTNVLPALVALLSITAGTLYQKRHAVSCDVRSANFVQLVAALLVSLPLLPLESSAMHWNREVIIAMAWSVLVLTLGGSSLLLMLIRRGGATQVAGLMYLVPPCTALMAWALFDEGLSTAGMLGMALCVLAVVMVQRSAMGKASA